MAVVAAGRRCRSCVGERSSMHFAVVDFGFDFGFDFD